MLLFATMRTRRATYKCPEWRTVEYPKSLKTSNFKRLGFKRNVINYWRELGFTVVETPNGYFVCE